MAIAPTDFDHAEIFTDGGYVDACRFLDDGGADRPPIRMHVHRHDAVAGSAV
jgi:hypothetical protein